MFLTVGKDASIVELFLIPEKQKLSVFQHIIMKIKI